MSEENIKDLSDTSTIPVVDEVDLSGVEPTTPPEPQDKPLIRNVQYNKPWSSIATANDLNFEGEFITLPSAPSKLTQEILKQTVLDDTPTPESQEWATVIDTSTQGYVYNDSLSATVSEPNSHWAQGFETPTGFISGNPAVLKLDGLATLKDDQAVMAVRTRAKLGTYVSAPMWASGFWIRLKSPSEDALIELNQRIADDRVELGRNTYGLLHSNNTSYLTSALMDMVVAHVNDTSIRGLSHSAIPDILSVHDLMGLFARLCQAIWPQGVNYARSCVANPDQCKHVLRGKIHFGETHLADFSRFTASQKLHMTKRAKGAMTLEEVKAYQAQFMHETDRRVQLTPQADDLMVTLSVPMVTQHIASGYAWINGIETAYGEILSQSVKDRNTHLNNHARATIMRMYGHYVKSVTVGEHTITDRATIDRILNDLSENREIRSNFSRQVLDFIDRTTVSLAAIDSVKCPNCGGEVRSPKELPQFPDLIPLDIPAIFFTLLALKVREIAAR